MRSSLIKRGRAPKAEAAKGAAKISSSADVSAPRNQNLTRLLRKAGMGAGPVQGPVGKAFQGSSQTAAQVVESSKGSGIPLPQSGQPAAADFDPGRVRVHTDGYADRTARDLHADAFAVGNDLFFRSGAFQPSSPEGRKLLAHELAHVSQFQSDYSGRSEQQLESEADQASKGKQARELATGGFLKRLLRQQSNQRCTSVTVQLPGKITFFGTAGPISASVSVREDIPPGDYKVRYDAGQGSLLITPWPTGNLVIEVSGVIKGTEAQIKAYQDKFDNYLTAMTSDTPLRVLGAGSPGGTGRSDSASKGNGAADARKMVPADAKKQTVPGGGVKKVADPGSGKNGDGTPSGAVLPGDPKAATGGAAAPITEPPPQDARVPVVELEDPKQIEELKRRGLLSPRTADDIKAKLDKQEKLTFDETIALLEAMDHVIEKDAKTSSSESRENWLKWARFIQQHKDKISGKTKVAGDGITIAEMNEILATYKEYVGVKDAPPPARGENPKDLKKFEPEKRKSWNSLSPGEKEIWTKYASKYGPPVGDSGETDLHLTADIKFRMALNMSTDFMQAGAQDAAKQLFNDPLFIGGTVAGIGLYVAAWLAPEPIFSKAFAAGITAALLTVFSVSEIRNFAVAWMRLGDETDAAQTFEDLEKAAESFGKAIGGIGLRVLVTIATLLLGEALPTPKPPVGGGGGLVPATAGGPPLAAAAAEGVAIKVLADGTIIVLGPGLGASGQSMMASKGGGGGTKTQEPPKQKITVKEQEAPEDTHGLRDKPGGPQPKEGSEVGNFAHRNFERLKQFIPGNSKIVSEDIPAGAEAEHKIQNPSYPDKRLAPSIDRLDKAGQTVIELKPHGLKEVGLAEAKAYALEMDKYEPLPNGAKWKAKCITYDYDAVQAFLKKIGYLE